MEYQRQEKRDSSLSLNLAREELAAQTSSENHYGLAMQHLQEFGFYASDTLVEMLKQLVGFKLGYSISLLTILNTKFVAQWF